MKTFLTGLALCLLLGTGVRAQQDDGNNRRHDQQDQHSNRPPDQNREQHQSGREGQPPSADHRTPQAQAPPQNQQQPRNPQNDARAPNGARPQNENRQANRAAESNHQNPQAAQYPKSQNDNRAQQGRSIDHGAQEGDQRQRYSQQPDQTRARDQNGHDANRGRPSEQHGYASQRGDRGQIWQQARAQNWRSQHRTWQQRGGYHGYRVPTNRFSLYFGRGHEFRIDAFPLFLAGGYPRFQYNGYWVNFVDPIPEYWAADWYDTDEVYIDYAGDGYYLYDTRYPDDRIAVDLSVQ